MPPPTRLPRRLPATCLRRPPSSLRQPSVPRVFHFSIHSPKPFPRLAREEDLRRNSLDPLTAHRLAAEERAHYTRRSYYAAVGAVFCVAASMVLVSTYEIPAQPDRNDAPPHGRRPGYETSEPGVGGVTGGLEVRKAGAGIAGDRRTEEVVEQVPTGTSTVPYFPRTLTLPTTAPTASPALPVGVGAADSTYQLVGLGVRTVSFLGIQVYVVGLYVATSDIATLQARLVKRAAGTEGASTLVAGERERLRAMLLDAEGSTRAWDEVLKEGGVRSVLRIVPTRNTDYAHLRDGWVRGITARSQGRTKGEGLLERFEDEGFGQAMADFKAVFSGAGRKGVGKGKVLMLERGVGGELVGWVEGAAGPEPAEGQRWLKLGEVRDERVGRLVWLGYLAGKNVASEGARRSIVDGVMEFVERPVGTVETQVLVTSEPSHMSCRGVSSSHHKDPDDAVPVSSPPADWDFRRLRVCSSTHDSIPIGGFATTPNGPNEERELDGMIGDVWELHDRPRITPETRKRTAGHGTLAGREGKTRSAPVHILLHRERFYRLRATPWPTRLQRRSSPNHLSQFTDRHWAE